MQAVCNAQGHLQLLAKYPSDPRTAFELLNLDPSTRPFFPPKNSRWEQDEWHQELLETVDRRYTRLMELSSQSDGRGGDEHLKQYKLALTAASDLLFKDGPGRFYVDTVLPVLARVVHGQLPRCVWPRLRQFHRDLCAATWPSTGMLGVLRDSLRIGAADSGCFDSADASRWIGLLRLE
ncbi:hypothetical protein C8A00DRAFT_35170 [Chaetomidium leptoderma]|uniref:Uncharacterized protein n=1 Tax=Chaetomidium leptoderma TaxID=669021 RepID=A0AAN6VKZ5_9PEZI|nr:hypothetical protein C8A00DRAFT_35170 [Chaetomidium leptoderma]